jgi:hypothetical protein
MALLVVPGIHVLKHIPKNKDVDGRDNLAASGGSPGHDDAVGLSKRT